MSELDQQIENRRAKREALGEGGVELYPHRFDYDLEPSGVHQSHGGQTAEDLAENEIALRVPGRVKAIRSHGKTSFVDIHDGQAKLQVMIRHRDLEGESALILDHLDLVDYLGIEGTLLRTRTGELTLLASKLQLLSKALRPWPEKWHGLAEKELRDRQRYVDLVVNP